MGIYFGQRENPCPRCGGVVETTFISVGGMSYDQACTSCGVYEFSPEEERGLGANVSRTFVVSHPDTPHSVEPNYVYTTMACGECYAPIDTDGESYWHTDDSLNPVQV